MDTNRPGFIATLLIVCVTGCAGPHKLARDEQLSLSSQPRIHAVHHGPATVFVVREPAATAAVLDASADSGGSDGTRLQHDQPVDPAPYVKSRLVRALQANLHLANVRAAPDAVANDDLKTLKDVFKTGVVLDVRTMKWGRDDSRGYYSVRARMVRLEDSTVLWKTTCNARWLNDHKPFGAQLRVASDDCAARLSARVLGKDRRPVLVTGHAIPAEGLPAIPRIVADEQPIELPGLEMTPEERTQFEDERSARIDSRTKMSFGGAGADPRVVVGCAFFLPVCVVAGAAAVAVGWGINRTAASAREPSLIPERDSARLAAMLKEQTTSASLAERVSRLPESASVPAAMEAGFPRLVVRMRGALTDFSGRRIGVSIVAQAQAFPSPGTAWEPTEHRYEISALAWTAKDDEVVRQEIDEALDALADSIGSAYSPRLPGGTVNEPGKSVEARGPAPEDARQLAHQQQ